MKRKYIFILLCMMASMAMAGIHTYTGQSVLSNGKFVKISVQETGVHSISYEMLKGWGLNPEIHFRIWHGNRYPNRWLLS